VRLKCADASVHPSTAGLLMSELPGRVDSATTFGDAGALEPDVYVLVRHRIVDLTGLIGKEQMLSLLRTELERVTPAEPAVAIISRKQL
jgi:N-methylhydantoinase A